MRDNKVKMRLHIKLNNYIHPIPTSPGQAMAAAQCDPIHLSIYPHPVQPWARSLIN